MAKMLGQLKVKQAAQEARGGAPAQPAHPASTHPPAQPGPAIPVSQRPPHGAPITRAKGIPHAPPGHEKSSPAGIKAMALIHQLVGKPPPGGGKPPPINGGIGTLPGAGTGQPPQAPMPPGQPQMMHGGGMVKKKSDNNESGGDARRFDREQEAAADESAMGVDAANNVDKRSLYGGKYEGKWGVDLSEGDATPMDDTRPRHYADGGVVPGKGNKDTVPAVLTPGEIVVPKEQAAKMMKDVQRAKPLPPDLHGSGEAHDYRDVRRPRGSSGAPPAEASPAPAPDSGILDMLNKLVSTVHDHLTPATPEYRGIGSVGKRKEDQEGDAGN